MCLPKKLHLHLYYTALTAFDDFNRIEREPPPHSVRFRIMSLAMGDGKSTVFRGLRLVKVVRMVRLLRLFRLLKLARFKLLTEEFMEVSDLEASPHGCPCAVGRTSFFGDDKQRTSSTVHGFACHATRSFAFPGDVREPAGVVSRCQRCSTRRISIAEILACCCRPGGKIFTLLKPGKEFTVVVRIYSSGNCFQRPFHQSTETASNHPLASKSSS